MSQNKFDLRHKETIQLFLKEFFELFFPEIAPKIRFETVRFIDKELIALFFSQETQDRENRSDTLALAEALPEAGEEVELFLIHWEQQGDKEPNFNERMFHYFCGIYYKFRKPIFPIAIFTDAAKWRVRVPDRYSLNMFGHAVATYGYRQIKLKDFKAEEFEIKLMENPLAAAYLPLTDYPAERRPEIKAKAVKGIANVEQGKKRATLYSLIHISMALDEQEQKQYRELIQNHPDYKEVKMLESIEAVGIEKGIEKGKIIGIKEGKAIGQGEGKADMIARLIKRKFGDISPVIQKRLKTAKVESLDQFGEAIFDFESLEDAEKWWEHFDKGRA